MIKAFGIIGLFILVVVLAIGLQPAYKQIDAQYSRRIYVDKSEKIEQALSNAVEDVTSRRFIVISTSVKKCVVDDDFIVEVCGVDKGHLLSLGK